MGKRLAGIPCLECEHRFTDDEVGKVTCPNCHSEYRLRITDRETGEKILEPYVKVGSSSLVSSLRTPGLVKGRTDEATKKEALLFQSLLPTEDECFVCKKPLTFVNKVRGKIKTGRVYVTKNTTDYVKFKDGSSEVFHNQESFALPESVAIKTKTVNVCIDHVGCLVKVLPTEKNLSTDRWAKKTGARRQHYIRQVDERTAHEAKADGKEIRSMGDSHKVISQSKRYFERIG